MVTEANGGRNRSISPGEQFRNMRRERDGEDLGDVEIIDHVRPDLTRPWPGPPDDTVRRSDAYRRSDDGGRAVYGN